MISESELQGIVIERAEREGWMVKPSSQGSKQGSRPQRAMRNKTANGFPDLTLGRNGSVLFFELKDDDGQLSPAQLRWLSHLPGSYIIRPCDLDDGRLDRILERD